MKTIIAIIVGATTAMAVVAPADAAQYRHKVKRAQGYGYVAQPYRYPSTQWYPRNADQLKVGSKEWYQQMQDEGRFGGNGRGGGR